MTDADHSTDDRPTIEILEQRITALEDENEVLKTQLDQHQDGRLPDVTRRQALGGLLGGGALLGAAGTASAQPNGGDGDPFADEGHDHSSDYLGKGEPVDRIDSRTVTATDELNNVEIVRPGDDIQAAIDAVHDESNPPASGMVRFVPNRPDDSVVYEFPDPPYIIRSGVTLDMSGIRGRFTTDAKAIFQLRLGTDVIGNGAFLGANNDALTGTVWWVSGDVPYRPAARDGATVTGFPSIRGHDNTPILLEQTIGNKRSAPPNGAPAAVGGCRFEVNCYGTDGVLHVNSAGGDDGGWINHNGVIATGGVFNGDAVRYESNGGGLHHNHVLLDHMQVYNPVDRILYCKHNGSGSKIRANKTVSRSADLSNANTTAEWTSGVGYGNTFLKTYTHFTSEIDNSGKPGNFINDVYNMSAEPYDLSDRTTIPLVDGEVKLDDGTNTAHRGVPCTWDKKNQVWVRPDGTTFTKGAGDRKTYSIEKKSLSIDGDAAELANVASLSLADDFAVYVGDPTKSGPVWLTWDSSNLYLAAEFQDNVHSNPTGTPLYVGDAIQLGVADDVPAQSTKFAGLTMGLTPNGPQVTKVIQPNGSTDSLDAPLEIVRNDQANTTIYEIAIPWSELPTKPSAGRFGANIAVSDRDENNVRSGLLEWAGGIYGGKNPGAFNIVELTDE